MLKDELLGTCHLRVCPRKIQKDELHPQEFQSSYVILVSFWMISIADLTELLRFGCFRHHFDVLKIKMEFERILEKELQN